MIIEKIGAQHRERKAMLYIRQSSAQQVLHNRESRTLQYAMRERLATLGWSEIEIIDEDLGLSAAGGTARAGFERMVAEVCLGKVGAVAAREVSRFARNSRDWQQLVEMCRVVDTLLIDQETIYAPRQGNDRLLLGLKGSLNEYELDLLRQRSLSARYEKARRGELFIVAPIGFIKVGDTLEKDPDQRVQASIRLVLDKVTEVGSVRQALLWFLEQKLDLPAKRRDGTIVWARPRYSTLHNIVTNPTYGGAYAYGKTGPVVRYNGPVARPGVRRKPREDWLTLQPGVHEGYVDWQRAESIRKMVSENAPSGGYRGAPKHGAALLAGLLRCRRCGQKLTVHYSGSKSDIPRYVCATGRLDPQERTCISFGGLRVDDTVEEALLAVVQPAAAEAALAAEAQARTRRDQVREVLGRDLEAARYAADRAFRQYNVADPENRLITRELEARWERALKHAEEVERRIADHDAAAPRRVDIEPVCFATLAQDLKSVWSAPATDARLKKRIARTVIKEAIADIDDATSEIVMTIHWVGGVHTEHRLPLRRRGQRNSTPANIIEAVGQLALIAKDDVIAGLLNRNGIKTGNGNRWIREAVTSLRSKNRIPVHRRADDGAEPWLNLRHAATLVGVTPRTLRLAAERGEINALHPVEDGPWIFKRADLEGPVGQALALRAASNPGHPAIPSESQKDLLGPTT